VCCFIIFSNLCALGVEETGGYKGYGLNMMVEILCGILADAAFGINIRSWSHPTGEANLVCLWF
jgi:LDH2 family malate/lactate/ureidoglycolate dehydrogenase